MAYITKGNKIITEDYVSFETAKLLKEKGFDEATYHDYDTKGRLWFNDVLAQYNQQGTGFACPTLQMVVKWLRETHGFNINTELNIHGYFCSLSHIIRDLSGRIIDIEDSEAWETAYYDSYEQAVEAAIRYCLENLI